MRTPQGLHSRWAKAAYWANRVFDLATVTLLAAIVLASGLALQIFQSAKQCAV